MAQNLSGVSIKDLWVEIFFRKLKSEAEYLELNISDEELRSIAEDAYFNNDDEIEDLYRRVCEELEESDDDEDY